jgi:hypothetical protein
MRKSCPAAIRLTYGSSPFQPAARKGSSGTINRVAITGRGELLTRNPPIKLSSMYASFRSRPVRATPKSDSARSVFGELSTARPISTK